MCLYLPFSHRFSLFFYLFFSRSIPSVFFFFCCLDLTSDLFPSRRTGCFFSPINNIVNDIHCVITGYREDVNFPRRLEIIAHPLINHTCRIIVITELLMIFRIYIMLLSFLQSPFFLSPAWWCCIVISNDVASTNKIYFRLEFTCAREKEKVP